MARSSQAAISKSPANVKGAKRNHPRLRVVRNVRPTANYEIVHGALVLPDPDHEPTADVPFKLAYYFPGEVVQLSGNDAEMLLARGIVVPAGEVPVLHHTMPDRTRSYEDKYLVGADGKGVINPHPEPEGHAKMIQLDIEQAAERLYAADSSQALGGLNGSGR